VPIEESMEAEIDGNDFPNHQGPLTRSSVKPRLLFPSARQIQEKEMRLRAAEEEEADTDIELPIVTASSARSQTGKNTGVSKANLTPVGQFDEDIATPKAPRFAPYSPPTTSRATRSKQIDISSYPIGSDDDRSTTPTQSGSGSTKISPFMGWQRVKGEASKGTKRQGASLARSPAGKKTRRV
jgi:hypothetical protein